MSRRKIHVSMVILAGLWVGILIGVSFIATIAQFSNSGHAFYVSRDLGNTFGMLAPIEWGLGAAFAILIGLAGCRLPNIAASALVVAILILQAVWLLPTFDTRVSMIIANMIPPAPWAHVIYIVSNLIKIAVLAELTISEIRSLTEPTEASGVI
jgi:hypothetical protein